jgi:hypothetical protein
VARREGQYFCRLVVRTVNAKLGISNHPAGGRSVDSWPALRVSRLDDSFSSHVFFLRNHQFFANCLRGSSCRYSTIDKPGSLTFAPHSCNIKLMSRAQNRNSRGKFLTFVIAWEGWGVLTAFSSYPDLNRMVIQSQPFRYIDVVSKVAIPIAIAISLVGIWKWRRWGVYALCASLAYLFVETIVTFFLAPEYFPGLPVFILISLADWLLWWYALRRKWNSFV